MTEKGCLPIAGVRLYFMLEDPRAFLSVSVAAGDRELHEDLWDMFNLGDVYLAPHELDEDGFEEGGFFSASGHKRDLWSFMTLRPYLEILRPDITRVGMR